MVFERKLKKEAYFIFKMTGPTGQFGLLVSALRFPRLLSTSGISLCVLNVVNTAFTTDTLFIEPTHFPPSLF